MIRTVWNKMKQLNDLMNRHSNMLYHTEIIMRRLHALTYIDAEQYRRSLFPDVVTAGKLQIKGALITRDNINSLIREYFDGEIDLLSIDIDGNDIYVLEAIDVVTPRVIIIEYNGKFPPPLSIAQRYNPEHR